MADPRVQVREHQGRQCVYVRYSAGGEAYGVYCGVQGNPGTPARVEAAVEQGFERQIRACEARAAEIGRRRDAWREGLKAGR